MLAGRLPALEMIDYIMYKVIAVRFAFFTIPTILGCAMGRRSVGKILMLGPAD